jgi:hypothetical protein
VTPGVRMPINIETLATRELENLIDNHRRRHASDAPLYLDAFRELGKRKDKGLEFDKSLSIILQAVKECRFLGYKELAASSGVIWNQARFAMNQHLWKLVEYSHLRHKILFSAIVVNTPNVATGKMDHFEGLYRRRSRPGLRSHRRGGVSSRAASKGVRVGAERSAPDNSVKGSLGPFGLTLL